MTAQSSSSSLLPSPTPCSPPLSSFPSGFNEDGLCSTRENPTVEHSKVVSFSDLPPEVLSMVLRHPISIDNDDSELSAKTASKSCTVISLAFTSYSVYTRVRSLLNFSFSSIDELSPLSYDNPMLRALPIASENPVFPELIRANRHKLSKLTLSPFCSPAARDAALRAALSASRTGIAQLGFGDGGNLPHPIFENITALPAVTHLQVFRPSNYALELISFTFPALNSLKLFGLSLNQLDDVLHMLQHRSARSRNSDSFCNNVTLAFEDAPFSPTGTDSSEVQSRRSALFRSFSEFVKYSSQDIWDGVDFSIIIPSMIGLCNRLMESYRYRVAHGPVFTSNPPGSLTINMGDKMLLSHRLGGHLGYTLPARRHRCSAPLNMDLHRFCRLLQCDPALLRTVIKHSTTLSFTSPYWVKRYLMENAESLRRRFIHFFENETHSITQIAVGRSYDRKNCVVTSQIWSQLFRLMSDVLRVVPAITSLILPIEAICFRSDMHQSETQNFISFMEACQNIQTIQFFAESAGAEPKFDEFIQGIPVFLKHVAVHCKSLRLLFIHEILPDNCLDISRYTEGQLELSLEAALTAIDRTEDKIEGLVLTNLRNQVTSWMDDLDMQ